MAKGIARKAPPPVTVEKPDAEQRKWEKFKTQMKANPGHPVWKELALDRIRRDPLWWMKHYVYTYDQMDEDNRIKPFPADRPYFPILTETILRDKKVIIVKSRQLTTSWFLIGLCQWKSLFFEYSECYVQCTNEDAVNYFVQNRMQAIYKRLPEWQKMDVGFSFCSAKGFKNGSFVTGIPSGADKSRGRAPAIFVSDELAFQVEGQDAFGNILPAIGGDSLAVAATTPNMKNFVYQMCFPEGMEPIETITPFPDYPKTKIIRYEGHTVIFLHYTADPEKRSKEWYDEERAKFFAQGFSEEKWEQEYELSFEKTGMPKLFSSYDPAIHEASVEFNPDWPIIRGWDFGAALPACVFMQHNKKTDQVIVLDALMLEQCNLDDFAAQVLEYCKQNFKATKNKEVTYRDFCDYSGNQKHWLGVTTQILRRNYKIFPRSRPSKPEERAKLIRSRLQVRKRDGLPGIIVNRKAIIILAGFRGAWTSKKDIVSGRPTGIPHKDNFYEHSLDAMGYAFDMLFGIPRDPKRVKEAETRNRYTRKRLEKQFNSVSGFSAA